MSEEQDEVRKKNRPHIDISKPGDKEEKTNKKELAVERGFFFGFYYWIKKTFKKMKTRSFLLNVFFFILITGNCKKIYAGGVNNNNNNTRFKIGQDDPIEAVFYNSVRNLKVIYPNGSSDQYYINLMNSFYQGANQLITTELAYGTDVRLRQLVKTLMVNHLSIMEQIEPLVNSSNNHDAPNQHFLTAVRITLNNLQTLRYTQKRDADKELATILIKYYGAMNQINKAKLEFDKNGQIKELCLDATAKQTQAIDQLKAWGKK